MTVPTAPTFTIVPVPPMRAAGGRFGSQTRYLVFRATNGTKRVAGSFTSEQAAQRFITAAQLEAAVR